MKNLTKKTFFILLLIATTQFGCKSQNKNGNSNIEILSETDEIIIPFEMYRNDIRMRAKINNKECYVLLDNGSLWDPLMFFGSPKVDSLELNKNGTIFLGDSTVANPIIADLAKNVSIAFEDIKFENQEAVITRYIPGMPNLWEGADLQVSAAFFKNFIVEINFDKSLIKLTPPKKFKYRGNGQELKMKIGPENTRLINANIIQLNGKKISINLLLDIGGIHPLYLPLGKRDDITLPENAVKSSLAFGIMGYKGRIKEIKLGKYKLNNILVGYTEVDKTANEYGNTMIGIKLIERFNITFDYPNERIFIEPSENFKKHIYFNLTGLELRVDKQGNLRVTKVYPNTQAEKVGIIVNDIITHINKIQTKDYEKEELKTILNREGKKVKFSIKSKGKSKQITIKLKDIL